MTDKDTDSLSGRIEVTSMRDFERKGLRIITQAELKQNNTEQSAWICVRGFVYNVTKFLRFHPGGRMVLLRFAGTECTKEFDQNHGDDVLLKYHKRFVVGVLENVGTKKNRYAKMAKIASRTGMLDELPVFGELFPDGDPHWYQGWASPYYNESHRKFRAIVRKFVDKEVIPYVHAWDEAKKIPKSFLQKAAQFGLLPACLGAWPEEKYVTYQPPFDPDDFNHFHELILIDELSRCASGGALWSACGGLAIGLPPVVHFASDYIKEKVVKPVLAGEKIICLAITEPWGGSDVANLTTTAKKSPCGKFYILNGEKKWITNGVTADFFTVAVRTGGPGMKGVSLLLVERSEGVTTKQMNCMGVWASGTTYITFENVKVPVENLIGKENKGFRYIMHNFNHERWMIIAQSNRFARVCLEEALKFASRRRAFGKRLIDQPVIRAKVADMMRQVTATHAALEDLTYQFDNMPEMLQPLALGGHTALLKVQSTRTFEFCAREAAQILGGCSYTRGTGGSGKIERLYREVRAYAIPGGSEEIMADLGVRQSLKISELVKGIVQELKHGQSKL